MRRAAALRSLLAVGLGCLLAVACTLEGERGGEGALEAEGAAGAPASSAPSREAVASDLPADSLEVRVGAFLLRWVEATEAGDTDALRALYVDDGRLAWLEDGELRYRSVDEVLAGLASLGPSTALRTVLGEVEAVRASTGAVHAWTPFTTTVGEGESRFTFRGMLSVVLEPDDSGWRILGGHTSSPGAR